jgi:cbb3-type cytochrome oxidase subunit 3
LFNNNFFSPVTLPFNYFLDSIVGQKQERRPLAVFLAASFLVSVPVFFQAPLVRAFPWLSLALTLFWVGLGSWLYRREQTVIWGDLLLGFSWSWLAGSLYWGWLRQEPFWHIPVESIGVPFAIYFLGRGWGAIGNLFYLGSLLGTAVTDLYFYITDLIPYWKQLMQAETALAPTILKEAIVQIQNPWGIAWAIVLTNFLLAVVLWAIQKTDRKWWAFSGAVLSTILVDSLFWLAAAFA